MFSVQLSWTPVSVKAKYGSFFSEPLHAVDNQSQRDHSHQEYSIRGSRWSNTTILRDKWTPTTAVSQSHQFSINLSLLTSSLLLYTPLGFLFLAALIK